jgi:hypothetical protein
MDPDLLNLDDLPAEARSLIDAAERDEITIRDRAEREVDRLRARAELAVSEVQSRADDEVRARQQALLQALKPLQDQHARQGKLDEALAIRERIRGLKANLLRAQPDPGSLAGVDQPQPGMSQLFDVTGSSDGMVWGSDVYTGDSTLATAAVHAGVLQPGERGVVRVTFVDTLNVAFVGSERNGILSDSFGPWPVGYRVQRA